ncbi:LLM class flavin-dependent oxidoreductase [Saccharibacillus sacchari]|uniref:LLM class flavin-dependent oxidoreductase n=1 Tax=Saccharibacillus sacchari TaxID=456493 RepID=A0ACC6P9G9_9BACL
MSHSNLALSVLDLLPIREGKDAAAAIKQMVGLAQTVEQLGYTRYWIAEHHNTPTLISSATSILVKHVLDHTEIIRAGSGGVMLPNHSPLIVAEQFGTIATIHPDRVDLGLGRAPGTNEAAAAAIRRFSGDSAPSFPDDIQSLLAYLGAPEEQAAVRAYPGIGTKVPLYILGSSTDSAYLAGALGLPYAFGAHFAPAHLEAALAAYRASFNPSAHLSEPYVMVSANVVAADSDEEADFLSTTMNQVFLNILRSGQQLMQPPAENLGSDITMQEKEILAAMSSVTFKGSKDTIAQQLALFQNRYAADELIVNSFIYDEEKLKRSFEILKEAVQSMEENRQSETSINR